MNHSRPASYPKRNWTLNVINQKKTTGQPANPIEIGWAIVTESKINRNYTAAEDLFQQLLQAMHLKIDTQGNNSSYIGRSTRPNYIDAFRKACTTMVRYARSPQKAIDYACWFLKTIDAPLKDSTCVQYMVNNLIYVHACSQQEEYLRKGLDFVRIGLGCGLAGESTLVMKRGETSNKVFEQVCRPLLVHFKLRIAPDRKSLETISGHPLSLP
ncbi:hypothetical protein BDF14DRAFT_1789293 [Spinellus fusiger]|nr:hypothetical protein BDF14DRAFT_1789293 [Spinellus fusiger]